MKQLNSILFQFILVITSSFCNNLNAQGGFQTGYVITNNNDTLFGDIKAKYTLYAGKHKVILQVSDTKEKLNFSPLEIKRFKRGEDIFEVIDLNKIISAGIFEFYSYDSLGFAQVLVKGFLSLYEISERSSYTTYGTGHGGSVTNTSWLLKKNNSSSLHQVKFFGYKKQMLNYFEDCRALQDKISDRELVRNDMIEIVKFYNEHCGLR